MPCLRFATNVALTVGHTISVPQAGQHKFGMGCRKGAIQLPASHSTSVKASLQADPPDSKAFLANNHKCSNLFATLHSRSRHGNTEYPKLHVQADTAASLGFSWADMFPHKTPQCSEIMAFGVSGSGMVTIFQGALALGWIMTDMVQPAQHIMVCMMT